MRNLRIGAVVALSITLSGCGALSQSEIANEKDRRIEFDTTKDIHATYDRLMQMTNDCWKIEYATGQMAEIQSTFEPGSTHADITDVWQGLVGAMYPANIALTATDHGTHVIVTYMYTRIGAVDSKHTAEGVQKWLEGDYHCYGGF